MTSAKGIVKGLFSVALLMLGAKGMAALNQPSLDKPALIEEKILVSGDFGSFWNPYAPHAAFTTADGDQVRLLCKWNMDYGQSLFVMIDGPENYWFKRYDRYGRQKDFFHMDMTKAACETLVGDLVREIQSGSSSLQMQALEIPGQASQEIHFSLISE